MIAEEVAVRAADEAAGLCPLRPYEIRSLWNMLRFEAHLFVSLIGNLADLSGYIKHGLSQKGVKANTAMNESVRSAVIALVSEIEGQCRLLQLSISEKKALGTQEKLAEGCTYEEVGHFFDGLREIVQYELESLVFMHIPTDKAKYYQDKKPFGDGVADKFPEAAYDIEEAVKCFALTRWTATGFI